MNTILLNRTRSSVTGQTISNVQLPTGSLGAFTVNAGNNTFTFTGATSVLLNIVGVLIISNYTGFATLTIQVRKNGVSLKTFTTTSPGFFDLTVSNVSFALNDTLTVSVAGITGGATIDYSASLRVESDQAIPTTVLIGDPVKMNDALPANILQKDVFADILKLFNLYVTEDKFSEKKLVIKPFVEFFNGSTAEDWSAKVDRSKAVVIKPMSELNARYYSFKYKDDSDFWNDLYKKRFNETYGSRIYDSEFEFAKETAKVELIFSPTVLVGYSGEDKIFSTIFKSSNGNEETIDSNIRLLLLNKITGVASWKIKDAAGVGDLSTQTEYLYAGHLSHPTVPVTDLNFGATKELFLTVTGGTLNVNQFNVYYSTYMAEITDKDSKLLSCTLKLSSMDYYNLAFNRYKWIDGSLWRLNKIIEFNATREDTCKAEFIKLINTAY